MNSTGEGGLEPAHPPPLGLLSLASMQKAFACARICRQPTKPRLRSARARARAFGENWGGGDAAGVM